MFTSEAVCEGHPDKLCDQISDTILDAILKNDPNGKCACETAAKDNHIVLLGEITTSSKLNYDELVRKVILDIGFDDVKKGIDGKTCDIINYISEQSKDIAEVVHVDRNIDDIGAGDQGIMFGYATDETPELFPATILYAQRLAKKLSEVRHNGTLPYLRPDGKTQVTMEYRKNEDGSLTPLRLDTIVISAQHDESVTLEKLREDIEREVIGTVFAKESKLFDRTKIYINKYGKFVIGGPTGDAGLTGRKIIVDSYGGWGNHGGGAFSGKDYTKVDRSAAYACRQLAKSVVAEGWAHRCLVQVSYVIGGAKPLSVYVDTYGSGKMSDEDIAEILSHVDMRPHVIAERLQLSNPIYSKTAVYGHFARDDIEFPWEKPISLKEYVKAEEK